LKLGFFAPHRGAEVLGTLAFFLFEKFQASFLVPARNSIVRFAASENRGQPTASGTLCKLEPAYPNLLP
jgi:hypothetical protein